MNTILKDMKRVQLSQAKNLMLLDTCFIVASLDNGKEMKKLLKIPHLATTSFNIEELLNIHHLKHNIRKNLRNFLKDSDITVVDVDVHPGEWKREREFVNSVNEELLKHVHDASDAVLMAVAIKTNSDVATKDKHHLFTADLENFVKNHNIKVFKDLIP